MFANHDVITYLLQNVATDEDDVADDEDHEDDDAEKSNILKKRRPSSENDEARLLDFGCSNKTLLRICLLESLDPAILKFFPKFGLMKTFVTMLS